MNIAVFGSHAGAHLICKKLVEEEGITHIYHLPAYHGIQPTTKYTPLQISGDAKILEFLKTTKLDLVFLTTIKHLCNEKIQKVLKEKNIPVASCSIEHAMYEWSKIHGKKILDGAGIPTTRSTPVSKTELLQNYFSYKRPWVLKFVRDWRAGLQTIIMTDDNYKDEFAELWQYGQTRYMHDFGDFSNQYFLVEEYLEISREYSYHIVCNSTGWKYLGSARDYKKFANGDKGFNTASMGCYSPVEINLAVHGYAERIVNYIKENGDCYKGILYLGIAEDSSGKPYVLEINTRPGDPEFETILLSLGDKFNLSQMLYECANDLPFTGEYTETKNAVALRVVNKNYREYVNKLVKKEPLSSTPIINPQIWPELHGMYISYSEDRRLLNCVISTTAESRSDAANKIYNFLNGIEMYDFIYRTDIGYLE